MELLAPAGGWESLQAAVQNGADAVYLGGGRFNARRFADNFTTKEDLERAFDYCHIRGVKTYVTMNTLLLDREMDEALHDAAFLYQAGADALIIQDLGLVWLLKKELPGLSLHASTQMTIHDGAGVRLCEKMGLARAVLARELSLPEIEEIHTHSPLPLECFGQGAMCTAVSGMCLFSSLAGGRSGNRGACAQPCRKPYVTRFGALSKEGYPLSLGDLCMLTHIGDMERAGICSVKLEGRMKRPEYVAAVTKAYRMAIDGAPYKELLNALDLANRVFSRGEGSTGYYFGYSAIRPNTRASMSGEDAPLEELKDTYRGERRKRPISAALSLVVGAPARLSLSAEGYVAINQTDKPVEVAQKSPDPDRYHAQVAKLGDTPFTLASWTLHMPEPAFLSMAALNGLRRDAALALMEQLALRRVAAPVALPALTKAGGDRESGSKALAIVRSAEAAQAAFLAGAAWVAIEPRAYTPEAILPALTSLQAWRGKGCALLLSLPAVIMNGRERAVVEHILGTGLIDGGVAQHPSQLNLLAGMSIRLGGPLINVTNGYALTALLIEGFTGVTLSLELNRAQIRDIIPLGGTGVYAYGRPALMQLRHCPVRENLGCQNCGNDSGALEDAKGRRFPLDPIHQLGGCLVRLRNCETMDLLSDIGELNQQPDFLMLEFFSESTSEIEERVRAALQASAGKKPPRLGGTRGHWHRGLD